MRTTQRVLDGSVWPLLFGGCHVSRDPVAVMRAAGFEVGPVREVLVPEQGPRLPSSYCVLGRARRPGAPESTGLTDSTGAAPG